MTTFAVTNSDELLPAVNYLLSNLDTQTVSGNISIPGNVLVANTTTGVVSQSGNANVFGYLYQYVNLRYSNNAVGTAGFDTNSNNFSYFGVFNSTSPTPSNNPSSYQWYEVSPPFDTATSRTLYYSAIGGRQIQWAAASSPPSSNYVITVANVAIDLDVVTTAAGTPGERGPVVMAGVITTADPNLATSATLTGWFEAPRNSATAPIGTGLIPPVLGDTASFTWAAGPGAPQAAYEYNGSIWIPVDGQVISGNVIVQGTIAGNAMIANTITATQIATGTITATQIAANTITAGQIAANTITAGQIAANTITGNNIAAGTITTNNFTANTIQGNIIAAGTITATQLAANAITANTVVSSGAVLGSYASLGFWLDGPSGNARFGNTVSIGNQLTVGFGANIGTLLTVAANANIGSSARISDNLIVGNLATIGANLVVGNNASIGANLLVGQNANIGANLRVGTGANIGTNLIVGNNATIGGNLTVTGLITGSNLNSNAVATLTIEPSAVTETFGVQSSSGTVASNASSGTNYLLTGTAIVSNPTPNSVITVNWSSTISASWSSGGSIAFTYKVFRSVGGGTFIEQGSSAATGPYPPFVVSGDGQSALYVDTDTATYGSGVTYRYQIYIAPFGTFTFLNITRNVAAIAAQVFKR
jgi:carbonic anhydrase/acetyltransferase-like protein (isoleucine patch superfamily)